MFFASCLRHGEEPKTTNTSDASTPNYMDAMRCKATTPRRRPGIMTWVITGTRSVGKCWKQPSKEDPRNE